MRAILVERHGGPEVLALHDLDEPSGPAHDEVLVRIHATGVNPVDAYMREGWYPGATPTPYTPGSDGAGIVAAVGDAVAGVSAGDRVFTSGSLTGTYAESALCRTDQVHPLPEHLSFAQGAALGVPYATAWRALFQRGGARRGEAVLIRGASGGVGVAAVQLAVAAGLEVTATAGSPTGRRLVRSLGATKVLDHGREDCVARLHALDGGRGFDLIVEMLANVNLGDDLTLLAARGRVVVVGSRGTVRIDPRDLMGRDGDVRAMRLPNASSAELDEIWKAIGAGLADGSLRPVVARELSLHRAGEAQRLVMEGRHRGKIVLLP